MKTRHILLPLLLWGLPGARPAWAGRDPFWPIGYSPAPPVSAKASESLTREPEQKPEPPPVKPITESDWASARKALTVSGTTKTVKTGSSETRSLVMINRQMFAAGDTVSFVHMDVRFQWRIESVTDKDVRLEPIQAERIVQKNTDLKQQR